MIITSHYHMPRAKFIFDYVLNHEKRDQEYTEKNQHGMCHGTEFGEKITGKYEIINPPYIAEDPETDSKVEYLHKKSFLSYMYENKIDYNHMNNLEKLEYERRTFKDNLHYFKKHHVEVHEDCVVNPIMEEYEEIEKVFLKIWPKQKIAV